MLDEILLQVEKPGRYIGNEGGMEIKDPSKTDIRFAFCFPDVYEVGMSHLGLQILYFFLNRREDTYCERAFAPWHDMEEKMRENALPLFSLETFTPLKEFDFVGFTLQYEMSYTNVINMLDLSGIPIFAKDRKEEDPLIIGGGPCTYNPEPLADFFDIFYIGEGEVSYDELLDTYKKNKKAGGTKFDFLKAACRIKGIYIPSFYDVSYNDDGTISAFTPKYDFVPKTVEKVIVKDLDKVFYPEKQLVPLIETVHDRVTLEVFRGCIRGCRFCQAGYVYRPVREKNHQHLLDVCQKLVESSGHEEISLTSLSTGDYREFKPLAEGLLEKYSKDNVSISLPSLRIDAFSLDLMDKVQAVRRSGLTFAPEAGSQRLRDVINKGITEEEILKGCELAFSGGWTRVKLYFMTGLPTETKEDLLGIALLADKIVSKYFEIPKEERKDKPITVVASAACFVPKPFTAFQWERQSTVDEFYEKQKFVKNSITRKQIKYNYHEPELSSLEGVLARGDRRLSHALYKAWQLGAKFDSWQEFFSYDTWLEAFKQTNTSPEFYANRQRSYDEILPWDHISIGVKKEFFIEEAEKAKAEVVTPNCRKECSHCGVARFGCGVCYE
ncbi:MAG: TIGR03960 family B12-binding radical SAM protein [Firmicutes bacterium]|nr:TIGR03960 family B12-binding radical SAM protein [Bacillota bacterium]